MARPSRTSSRHQLPEIELVRLKTRGPGLRTRQMRHTYRLIDARPTAHPVRLDGELANVTTKHVIIGLPGSGKSTVFNALSRSTAETGAFGDESIPHPEGSVDPARDIETMNLELAFSDIAVVDKRLQRVIHQLPKMKGGEREAYEREQKLME